MDLSIIIVNFNTEALLRQCLASIFALSHGITFEVIVVDNNSGDGSVSMIQSEYPHVRLVRNASNRGFAAANNVGLSKASGKYVLLLNSDTVLTPQVLGGSVKYIDDHADVGILGCKILNADGTLQRSARDFPTLWTLCLEAFFPTWLLSRSGLFRNPWVSDGELEQDVDVVKGAFFLTRRETIANVGSLDERFFLYSEEQDWCLRARKKGWRVIYWPDGEIYHHDGGSSLVERDSMRFLVFDSETEYFRKHFGSGYALIARLEMLGAVVVRLVLWSFLGLYASLTFSGESKHPERIRFFWYALLWHLSIFRKKAGGVEERSRTAS
jgi:GT2 family glycosyltransferase